jgi:hypothetical protein
VNRATHRVPGHLSWVMPVPVGASYGRVAAEEAAMAQQSPGTASDIGPAARPGTSGWSPVLAVLRAVVWRAR